MSGNPEQALALQFIEKTDRNLFITGKAGTGKTTLLHNIRETALKRTVIVAPTGVAAINAKGVTIHSFFQMPFGPILPDQENQGLPQQLKFSKTKMSLIKSLELLIVDEISMVRADVLDGIDQVLRRYKNRNKVFGGVQVLMIGDVQQLAPVVKSNEWSLLKNYYETIYFFSAKAYQQARVVSIELKQIYRQKNEDFITVLNQIRNNQLSERSARILNERYQPTFSPDKEEGYITLTTHNKRAHRINNDQLNTLSSKGHLFEAVVSGKFNENAFPNNEKLFLKVGAQVMFIKNDSSPKKRYYNGKIGRVKEISRRNVTVTCTGEADEIVTEREIWSAIKYSIDKETNALKEQVLGTFSQIPLRLAWAITIHKSQGLTFDKIIIDAEASFAHGQTYVALSRGTSLEGLVLKTPIKASGIIRDTTVQFFHDQIEENPPDESVLNESEMEFQLNLISELFDYHSFLPPVSRLIEIYYKNRSHIQGDVIDHLETIKNDGITALIHVSNNFNRHLRARARDHILPENSHKIQERFTKAVAYFLLQTQNKLKKPFDAISFSSDNKAIRKDFTKAFETLQDRMGEKLFALEKQVNGFGVQNCLRVRADAALRKPFVKDKKIKEKNEPILASRLRVLRDQIAEATMTPPFQVFPQETLYALCRTLPKSEKALLKIPGMGKIRVKKYGEEILATLHEYCSEHHIYSFSEEGKREKNEGKKSTKQITLELFKRGFSVKEIVKKRKLAHSTIESHLASYIPSGEIDVLELIPLKKYQMMVKAIEPMTFKNLTHLKERMDPSCTYMELRMVLLSLGRKP